MRDNSTLPPQGAKADLSPSRGKLNTTPSGGGFFILMSFHDERERKGPAFDNRIKRLSVDAKKSVQLKPTAIVYL